MLRHIYNLLRKTVSLSSVFHAILIVVICAIAQDVSAQKMSVASFTYDALDQTANLESTKINDRNGDPSALIKIVTTQKGFTFGTGLLGITETKEQDAEHPGEIWLYVPHGVKSISIQHPQLGVIDNYDLGMTLQAARTYRMVLTSDEVSTFSIDYNNYQYLDIEVTPSNATIWINGIKHELDNSGRSSIQLPFGTHTYRVSAPDYHTKDSHLTINDKAAHHHLAVELKKAFGYLTVNIPGGITGAELYIDSTHICSLPTGQIPLPSGNHRVTVLRPLYLPFTQDVRMTDDGNIVISPTFRPNSADYEIRVDGDPTAQIFDNGRLLGTGMWNGKLEAGHHTIEARKTNHTTVTEKINVVKDTPRMVSLSRPMPIYGTLAVVTTPENASVTIDGQYVGKSKYIDSHIIIGQHHVKLELPGYETVELDVEVDEGKTTTISRALNDFCSATIYSDPNAYLSIDGIFIGYTPQQINRRAGDYRITLTHDGYTPYSKVMHIDGNTKDINIKLHRNYIRSREFYLNAGLNVLNGFAYNVGMGFYISNFNVEGNYIASLGKESKIYWSDPTGEETPFEATYKPSGGNLKLGYGIRLHNRIRLTPQVGPQYILLKETSANYYYSGSYGYSYISDVADKSNAFSFSAGLRFNIAFASWIGISITPEYLLPINKSEGFTVLSEVSSKIKDLAEGFKCNVSLNIFF